MARSWTRPGSRTCNMAQTAMKCNITLQAAQLQHARQFSGIRGSARFTKRAERLSRWRVAFKEAEADSIQEEAVVAAHPIKPLNWYQQWYPVAVTDHLDPAKPHAVSLLGLPLVLWRGLDGSWAVMADRCPHRKAPLSEGRREANGMLSCSYHGWEFDSSGQCTRIPQIHNPEPRARACSSSKACVTTYPTKEAQGLLWVWPDSDAQLAAATPLPVTPELEEPSWTSPNGWFMRDMPVSLVYSLENGLDPAHPNYAHHGLAGSRSSPLRLRVLNQGQVTAGGFQMVRELATPSGVLSQDPFEFVAPSTLRYNHPKAAVVTWYVVPLATGSCRRFTRIVYSPEAPPAAKSLKDKVLAALGLSIAAAHEFTNAVLDGDAYLLYAQERRMLSEPDPHWRKAYFTPGHTDTAVTALHTWLDRYGRDCPVLPSSSKDLGPELPRQQVMDRWSQHTQHCPECLQALQKLEAAQSAATAVAAALLLGAAAAAGKGLLLAAAVCVLAAAAAAWVRGALSNLQQVFYFTDYVHAEKH